MMQSVSHAVRRLPVLAIALAMGGEGCGDDAQAERPANPAFDASAPASSEDASTGGANGRDATTVDELDADRTMHVEIELEARVGDERFDCTRTFAVGSASTRVMPLDFRMYVHDVALLTADGEQPVTLEQDGEFQDGAVTMLDFEDDSGSCSNGTAPTHSTIVGEVPQGEYVGLAFKIGVPEAQNHVNQAQAPSPLNVEGMF